MRRTFEDQHLASFDVFRRTLLVLREQQIRTWTPRGKKASLLFPRNYCAPVTNEQGRHMAPQFFDAGPTTWLNIFSHPTLS